MAGQRVTFKILKEWINDWNRDNPNYQMVARSYNDYYHIEDWQTGRNICSAKSPGLVWDLFWIWKDGFRIGRESVGDDCK